jgi:hypothetical protein
MGFRRPLDCIFPFPQFAPCDIVTCWYGLFQPAIYDADGDHDADVTARQKPMMVRSLIQLLSKK